MKGKLTVYGSECGFLFRQKVVLVRDPFSKGKCENEKATRGGKR